MLSPTLASHGAVTKQPSPADSNDNVRLFPMVAG